MFQDKVFYLHTPGNSFAARILSFQLFSASSEFVPQLLIPRENQKIVLHTCSLQPILENGNSTESDGLRSKKVSKNKNDSLKLLRKSLGSVNTDI